jgi:histidine kinase-like protein
VGCSVQEGRGSSALPHRSECGLTGRGDTRQAAWAGEPSVESTDDARHRLHALLVDWGVADPVVEDALLLVAELLANVVVHARTPFRLSVHLHGRLLRITVSDQRVGVPEVRSINPTGGRISGLRVVNAVATRWGWQEHATGKTVWVELVG